MSSGSQSYNVQGSVVYVAAPRMSIHARSPAGITVSVFPQSGDTIRVETSCTNAADTLQGAANWVAWPIGDVTVPTVDTCRAAITALRFTRTAGSGTTSTVEVSI